MSSFNVKTIQPRHEFHYKIRSEPKKNRGLKGIFLLIFVIIFVVLFTYVLPRVEVIVVPVTEDLAKEFFITLTTDKSQVNLVENIFPAEIVNVSSEAKGKFAATGEKDLGDKATGEAVFFNDTGRPQPLTTKIDLINDAGTIFVVTGDITIPGASVDDNGNVVPGQISTTIEAKKAGEAGNAPPGRINISALVLEKQEKIYGQITSGLTGGTSKIEVVVSQEDLDRAKDELFQQLEPKVKEKIIKSVGSEFVISDQLIEFDDSEIYQEVEIDKPAKNFDLTLNLKARSFVYNNQELRLHLRDQVLAELPGGQTIAETEFGNLEIEVENIDFDLGRADLKIKATFPVAEDINLEEVKQNILGQPETEARRYIMSLPNVKDARFMFSLSLSDKIPNQPNRVKVILGDIK